MIKTNKPKIFNISFCCSKEKSNSKEMKIKTEGSLKFLQKKRFCTCNKSKCNKNYCECFSKGENCNEKICSCIDCQNKININKNINLKPWICCSCQKSGCSKKYCECFNKGIKCNLGCTCMDCKNKGIFVSQNYFGFKKLKKIYIKNESIIIDNYKLNVMN